jgi:serine O-acetyltransferase
MDKFWSDLYLSHKQCPGYPSPEEVVTFFSDLLALLFPDFTKMRFTSAEDFEKYVGKLHVELEQILRFNAHHKEFDAAAVTKIFFETLPSLYEKINQDITAMYEGDPAAKSRSEVIRTYPGFYAIAAYRIAHSLNVLGVQIIPRIITEHAHSKTGIDIHPAAKIGNYFFIDHGTGVVIGETAVIGNYVKVYQGVTLGALSVSKEDAEKKRHPTIEDYVVIYAGATILGGNTVIGHNSIVGGNVWLTRSVPPYSKIYYQAKMYNGDTEDTDVVIFKAGKKGEQ